MIFESSNRRVFLAAAVAGLAGCSTQSDSDPTQGESSADPPADASTDAATSTGRDHDLTVEHDVTAWSGYDPEWSAPATNPEGSLAVDVLVERLETPWDLSFAPNGELFVTERTGRVLRYKEGEVAGAIEPADAIDAGSVAPGSDERTWFVDGGEGGTMGVAVHPIYPDPPVVYVYYTVETEGGLRNRLAYVDVAADDVGATARTLLEVPAGTIHNGGRLAFGPANYLWVTCGDASDESLGRDGGSLAAAVLRVTPEGAPAPDNGGFKAPELFTGGHRNPQCITWLPDATPVATEHGPGPDEVNRLVAGGDYGWPDARRPDEYEGTDYRRPIASSLVEQTTWAPSGGVFYTGSVAPLANRLLVGSLAGQRLKVFTITPPDGDRPPLGDTGTRYDLEWLDEEYTATSHDVLVGELGRIRHVEQGPDGGLYAITSNRDGRASGSFPLERDDALVRITTADATTDQWPAPDVGL